MNVKRWDRMLKPGVSKVHLQDLYMISERLHVVMLNTVSGVWISFGEGSVYSILG